MTLTLTLVLSLKESQFITELKKSFNIHRIAGNPNFFYKIMDMPHFTGKRTRFDTAKPFDCFALVNGWPIAIEAKLIRKFQAFGKRHLRDCQIEGLEYFERAGGKSFVFLNIRIKAVKGIQKHENRLLIFPWQLLKNQQESFTAKQLRAMDYVPGMKGEFPLWYFYQLAEKY